MHSSYTFDSYWPHAILPCCTSWVCLVTLDLVLMQALSDVAAKLSAHRVPIAAVGLDNHQELCIMSPPVNTRPGGLTPTKVRDTDALVPLTQQCFSHSLADSLVGGP